MIKRIQRRIALSIHLTFWFFFSALMAIVLSVGTGQLTFAILATLTSNLSNAAIVYINLYLLIPRLFIRRKFLAFGTLLLCLGIALTLVKYLLFMLQYSQFDGPAVFYRPLVLPVLTTFFMIVVSFLFYSLSSFFEKFRQGEILKAQKQEAESRFLQVQMNPHFLFNCLNSVQGLVLNDQPKEAERYLTRFSKLVRQSLDHSRLRWIPLEEEVRFLKTYMDLERFRMDGRFRYDLTLDAKLEQEEVHVPAMMIQPLIENAIIHGVSGTREDGEITVHFAKAKNGISVEVLDNGHAQGNASPVHSMRPEGHTSVALKTMRKRLELYSKRSVSGPFSMTMEPRLNENSQGRGMRVRILIPTTDQPQNDQIGNYR